MEAVAREDVLLVVSYLRQLPGSPSRWSDGMFSYRCDELARGADQYPIHAEAASGINALEAAVGNRSSRSLLITKMLLEFGPEFSLSLG